MEETLTGLIEIAGYLGQTALSEKLVSMKNALEKDECVLAVMGQFSAGKSCLINNLVGKQVLPVHITETTAAVTFVKYGSEEYAQLEYEDGSVEEVTIAESLDLWQRGADSEKLEKLSNIIIYVDCLLLQNGLIIADTPGVNTVIGRHVELTMRIINRSDRVLYVMGKSVTASDQEFVWKLRDSGTEITFVRTHMDEVKNTEENAGTTMRKEQEILERYTSDPIFFVSNLPESSYYADVEKLRLFLSTTLARDVRGSLKKSISSSMVYIAQKLKIHLEQRLNSLENLISGNKAEYDRRRGEIEGQLKKMEEILSENKKRLDVKYDRIKQDAEESLRETKDQEIQRARRVIFGIKSDEPDQYKKAAEDCLKEGMLNLQIAYVSCFESLLRENSRELYGQLSNMEAYIQIDVDIPDSFEASREQSEMIEQKRESLSSLQAALRQEINEIEHSRNNQAEHQEFVEKELEMYRDALENVKQELADYPDYEEKYIIMKNAAHDNERIWRNVGNVLDWATIFVPGKGWQTLTVKILKSASNVAKAAKAVKVAEALTQAAKKVSKAKKAFKTFDKGMDIVRGVKKFAGNSSQGDEEESKATLLDYLSIEYHLAKIGKSFDSPEIKQIDRQHEMEYTREKKRIEERMRKSIEDECKKRQELLDIKEEEERLKLQEDISRKNEEKARREIEKLDEQMRQARRDEKVKALRKHYCDVIADKINELSEILRSSEFIKIDERVRQYIKDYDFNIAAEIAHARRDLDRLAVQFEHSDKAAAEEEIETCYGYKTLLEAVVSGE